MFPPPPNCDPSNFESFLKSSPQNPTTNPNPNPSLHFNFPSPFLDEHESPLNQIFSQPSPHDHTGKSKMEEIPKPRLRRSLGVIPRRRAGKKDRHSKICTAQGIRDRRMRLSLQVARKFFDLQDMLGYDKASKTIEWLFNQSKKAINELVDDLNHQSPPPENNGEAKTDSFVSECEEMSGIEETNSSNVVPIAADADPLTSSYKSNARARESRDRARARARCRTREKMLVKLHHFSGDFFKPNPNDVGKLNNPSPFEGDQNTSIDGIRVSPFEGAYNMIQHQLSDIGTIEKFLGNSSSSTTCPISDYPDPNSSSFMGFLGNWDLLSIDRTNCYHYSVPNQVSLAGLEFP